MTRDDKVQELHRRFEQARGVESFDGMASVATDALAALSASLEQENDQGGTSLTAVEGVSVSEVSKLTHAVNDRLIALYDGIAHTAGCTREIAVAETGYFVNALVVALIENTAQSVGSHGKQSLSDSELVGTERSDQKNVQPDSVTPEPTTPAPVEQARQALEVCDVCNGQGEIRGQRHVTRDMAIDAGEPSMEGMAMEVVEQCDECQGAGYIPDDRVDALIAAVRAESPAPKAGDRWTCKANPQSLADPPQECDWPVCGCDAYATKVLETLIESGWEKSPAPGAGWQPMATAPKDGTRLLFAITETELVAIGFWWLEDEITSGYWCIPAWKSRSHLEPTHWMPLPPAPQETPE